MKNNHTLILTNVSLTGLFGKANSKPIAVSLESDEIHFITGRNGSGKTTLLKLLSAISKGDWAYVAEISFKALELNFSNQNEQSFYLNVKSQNSGDIKKITSNINENISEEMPSLGNLDTACMKLEAKGTIWRASCKVHWADRDESHMTSSRVLEKYQIKLIPPRLKSFTTVLIRRWSVHFIETSRLYQIPRNSKSNNIALAHSVDRLPDQMRQHIAQTDSASVRESQNIEHTLLNGILSGSNIEITQEIIIGRIKQYNRNTDELKKIQVYGNNQGLNEKFKNISQDSLSHASLVMDHLEKKVDPYLNLLDRINLFKQMISHSCPNLSFELNRHGGLLIKDGDNLIKPCDLSSGQQHQLLILCQLIFFQKEGTLVLFDEPEMSMDIEWQYSIVENLKKLSSYRDFQFLLATHSPILIEDNNFTDLSS